MSYKINAGTIQEGRLIHVRSWSEADYIASEFQTSANEYDHTWEIEDGIIIPGRTDLDFEIKLVGIDD